MFFSHCTFIMSNPRFFVPDVDFVEGEIVSLPQAASHHAMRVLRMRQGDMVELFSGVGKNCSGTIQFDASGAYVLVKNVTESKDGLFPVTLLQAFVANEKADWIIEKACEVGITDIYFYPASRCETKIRSEKKEKRLERWNKIVISACMQCGRNTLPVIHLLDSFKSALSVKNGTCFVTAPRAAEAPSSMPNPQPQAVTFLIGPEGGLSEQEIELSIQSGFLPLTLGKLVLRTETAGIVCATWAQTLWGEFRNAL